jgi:hypothetical protein
LIALMIDVRHRTLAGPTNRQCQKDHCLPNISDRNDHPSGTAVCWRAHHRPCRIYSLFTMLKNPRRRARRAQVTRNVGDEQAGERKPPRS